MRIAEATPNVALIRTGPNALGNMCWKMIRILGYPKAIAALTKSRFLNLKNPPLTSLATPVHLKQPITAMIWKIEGFSTKGQQCQDNEQTGYDINTDKPNDRQIDIPPKTCDRTDEDSMET